MKTCSRPVPPPPLPSNPTPTPPPPPPPRPPGGGGGGGHRWFCASPGEARETGRKAPLGCYGNRLIICRERGCWLPRQPGLGHAVRCVSIPCAEKRRDWLWWACLTPGTEILEWFLTKPDVRFKTSRCVCVCVFERLYDVFVCVCLCASESVFKKPLEKSIPFIFIDNRNWERRMKKSSILN